METTLKWLAAHRRGAVLGLALSLTIATGIASRALATRGTAGGGTTSTGNTQVFASQGSVRLAGELEGTKLLRGGDGLARVELTITGEKPERGVAPQRMPTDVLVVLDRSGSMEGEKLRNAHAAVRALLRELSLEDRFGLVAYASDAELVIPLGQVTRERLPGLDARIDSIAATTGTNMSGGMDLGIESIVSQRAAGRAARIIVISDGQANEGDATPEGLAGRARRAADRSVVVTSVGVGEGFDERVMGLIADAGTGNFYFLDQNRDLAAIFAREFDAARGTVASALEVEIKPAPGVRVVDAAGYPLETRTGSVVFSPGALFEGQERRIWVTLSVPEGAGEQSLGVVGLHWEHDGRPASLELPDAFRVAWADKPAEVAASIAPAAWERSIGNDAYGQLEDRVAEAVRNGDRAGAEREIEEFKQAVGALNQLVQSPAVTGKLQEADRLRSDVGSAFSGDNQARKQNALSKSKAESGKDSRRYGAKARGVK